MDELLEAIGYPLPEDVEKLKWAGRLDECLALIQQRLKGELPGPLRRKLEMEQLQIRGIRRSYTVPQETAEQLMAQRIRDYQPGELDALRRAGAVDWAFVDGKLQYIDSFYNNLIQTRKDIAARQIAPAPAAGRSQPEIREEAMAFMKAHGGAVCRMKLKARLHVDAPETGKTLRAWVPFPIAGYQMRAVKLELCTPEYTALAPENALQRTLYFEGPAETLTDIQVVYSLENHTRYVTLDPNRVSDDQPTHKFTGQQLPHIAFTPYLRALTAEVVGQEQNALKKARRIYDFITQNVEYSYMRDYLSLPVIPEYAASRLRGDCGVQSLLFITMCRIAGIPARWQSGLHADETGAGSHDWAMFYVAPFGWLFADCSFGGGAWQDGAKARWDFYFGNLDPYRVVLAQEFQQPFSPPSRFMRSDPYDNQRGEIEFADGPADRSIWQGGAETLEVKLQLPNPKNA